MMNGEFRNREADGWSMLELLHDRPAPSRTPAVYVFQFLQQLGSAIRWRGQTPRRTSKSNLPGSRAENGRLCRPQHARCRRRPLPSSPLPSGGPRRTGLYRLMQEHLATFERDWTDEDEGRTQQHSSAKAHGRPGRHRTSWVRRRLPLPITQPLSEPRTSAGCRPPPTSS